MAVRHGGSGDEVFRVCSEFNGDYSGVGGETPLAGKMARSSFLRRTVADKKKWYVKLWDGDEVELVEREI